MTSSSAIASILDTHTEAEAGINQTQQRIHRVLTTPAGSKATH